VIKKVSREGEVEVEFFGGANSKVDIDVPDPYSVDGPVISELICLKLM
jgi:hypothetical protein